METTNRVSEILKQQDADWAVLTGPDSVCYATGHIVGIEIGPTPFSGGPTTAFVSRDGAVGVVCPNVEAGCVPNGVESEIYVGFACSVTDQIKNYNAAVRRMIERLGIKGDFAVEQAGFTAALAELLPGNTVPIDMPLARARAVKTAPELEKLRYSAQVAAAGQEAARKISLSGISEVEALAHIRGVMERMAGERCALAGEYVSGVDRTSQLGTPPGAQVIGNGDPIVCDLAPRVNGYWGDSCGSFIVGTAMPEAYEPMFDTAFAALQLAISEIRPGLRIDTLDGIIRAFMEKQGYSYPHHTGHGIGTSVHEFPRIVPDETSTFEENMVMMVEPGSYVPGLGGLRVEYMLQVTATGAEIMAPFKIDCHL
ncbi:MAG: Xaa-Pro peptidase family protein [Stappiaceae bacterium]